MLFQLIGRLAFRYLKGKGSANAAPILSRISMVAIGVGSAAMIILFSVFNGFESLVKDNYKAFYPDLKVSPTKGKFFELDSTKLAAIKSIEGVLHVSTAIEDNVLVREDNLTVENNTNDNQLVVTLKGIDANFFKVNDIHRFLLSGIDTVSEGKPYTAIAGEHIIKELGVDYKNFFSYMICYYLVPGVTNPEVAPESAFNSLRLHPAGAFSVLAEFDSKYVLAPVGLVQKLFSAEGKFSSIEISANPSMINTIKSKINVILGSGFKLETRYEQNKTMYLVMNIEKWVVYLILLLVLTIASFNMVGALTMLVIEKQKDIAILRAMGAQQNLIRNLFLAEGVLWSLTGGVGGLLFGCAICLAQQRFGLIKISGAFLVDAYPVKIQLPDILLVIVTIIAVGFFAALSPALKAKKAADPSLKSA